MAAFPATHASFSSVNRSTNDRISAGLVVRLPREWSASADFVRSKSGTVSVTGNSYGDPDGTGPLPSFSTALAAGTLDVLSDLNRYPLNYTPYVLPQPASISTFDAVANEGTLRAAGPVWDLPAGPVTLALSASWRQETQPEGVLTFTTSVPSRLTWYPRASINQGWTYLETKVPVLSEKSASLLRALEFQGSVRYDTHRSTGRSETPLVTVDAPADPRPASYTLLVRKLHATSGMAGFKYAPVPDLALRVSWGTGFLPPSLSQMIPTPASTTSLTVADPKRGGALASTGAITLYQGGNTTLDPEFSENLSGGLVLTPRFLPGFRLSADYTRIEKRDEIASIAFQSAVDFEDFLLDSVERAPLTAADRALGYTGGQITAINNRIRNVSRRELTAYDFQVDYERTVGEWGRFHPYAIATYQPKLAGQFAASAPFLNNIGYTGAIRWRGNVGLDWNRGRWTAGWNMQYYDSYLGYSNTTSAAGIATFILNQGAAKIPSQHYHDLHAGYEFARAAAGWRRYLNASRLTAGVQNVFNTSPPILAGTSATGGYSGYGDPRLARYTLTMRRTF